MPKPHYILCSESGSEDKTTGLVSLFNLFDKVQFARDPKNQLPDRPLIVGMLVTAMWKREPGDEEGEFEHELRYIPPGGEAVTPMSVTFAFSPGKTFQRFQARFMGALPIDRPGLLTLVSRVRRAGGQWISQQCEIEVEEAASSSPAVQSQSGN